LRSFFAKTFKILWEDDDTEDGKAVLERLQASRGSRVVKSTS
jgi:hypothetical protein